MGVRRWVSGALALVAVGGLCVLAPTPALAADTPPFVAFLNGIRSDAGAPALTVDPDGVYGIHKHLIYLAKTPASQRTGQYASPHTENPASAYYSPQGAAEAANSDLTVGTANYLDALNGWLASPFHTIAMLRPGLATAAFYRDSATGAAGLDVITGLKPSSSTAPIIYPRHRLGLSRYSNAETPDPTESCTHQFPNEEYNHAGFPIVALLPQLTSYAGIGATLTRPDGTTSTTTDGNLCLVDAATWYSTAPGGKIGHDILAGDKALLLISRTPLTAGSYTAHLDLGSSYPGTVPDWTFISTPTPLPPNVAPFEVSCSFSGTPSGTVPILVTNPADDTGTVTYRVSVGDASVSVAVADGDSKESKILGVAAGLQTLRITGSDGTARTKTVTVATCPAYQGTRVKFGTVTKKSTNLATTLDNRVNAGTVIFAVADTASRTIRYYVKGGTRRTVHPVLLAHGRTAIGVRVQDQLLGKVIIERT